MGFWGILAILYTIGLISEICLFVWIINDKSITKLSLVSAIGHTIIFVFSPLLFPILLWRGLYKLYFLNRPEPCHKSWAKDSVLDRGERMSIAAYNKKHKTNYTLEQVYGKKYVNNLTNEEKSQFESFEHSFSIEEGLPQTDETRIAIAFATARQGRSLMDFAEKYIDDDTRFLIYERKVCVGKEAFVEYWENLEERYNNDSVVRKSVVRRSRYTGAVEIYDKPGKYLPMHFVFHVKDGKIDNAAYMPGFKERYLTCDMDHTPYRYDFITDLIEKQDALPFSIIDRMPCPCCWSPSEYLKHYDISIPNNDNLLFGTVSICPNCKKVVEFRFDHREHIEGQPLGRLHDGNNREGLFKPSMMYMFSIGFSNSLAWSNYLNTLSDTYQILSSTLQRIGPIDNEPTKTSLRDVASNFRLIHMRDMVDDEKENLAAIKAIYEKAFCDGVIEAGNNVGVIFYNVFNDTAQAKEWFRKATAAGSANARKNLFTLLWNDEEYDKAIEVLKQNMDSTAPSIQCLYNLAVLYHCGEEIKGNKLAKNADNVNALLNKVLLATVNEHEAHTANIIKSAKEFIFYLSPANEYARKGYEFSSLSDTLNEANCSDMIASTFPEIRIKEGCVWSMHMASDGNGNGEISYLEILDEADNKEEDITTCIKSQPNCMSAWQIYLLSNISHILPVFWHGGYSRRDYIFAPGNLYSIKAMEGIDYDILAQRTSLFPEVSEIERGRYNVSCCYWNDWAGLVRESNIICIDDSGNINIEPKESIVLYEYDCGIFF